MEVLFNLDIQNYDENEPVTIRDSIRGILFQQDCIALVYSSLYQYYKFPGGGIDQGESHFDCLKREMLEETGILIQDKIEAYGIVKRRQKSKNGIFQQDNYYYLVEMKETNHPQKLDDYENEEGFELRFVTLKEAIKVNRQCENINDFYKVMVERDTRILERLAGVEEVPNVAFAKFLLQEGNKNNPGPWLNHSLNVGLAAKWIAKNIEGMDEQKAYVFGLLHDIGRKTGFTYMKHVIDGYDYMIALGYENVAKICMTHSFNLGDIHDYIGKIDITKEQFQFIEKYITSIQYDDYDYLISLADSIGMDKGIVDIIERMSDVKRRHGKYPESKWNQNLYLKAYFEEKAGKTIEQIVKEQQENQNEI